jgi:hypothetical protein
MLPLQERMRFLERLELRDLARRARGLPLLRSAAQSPIARVLPPFERMNR